MKVSEPTPDKEQKDANSPLQKFRGILAGIAVGVLCELGGYLLMRGNQQEFGAVVFIGVPLVAGFFIAIFTPSGKPRVFGAAAGTLFLTLSILIFTGLEGYICCFMALPLLLIAVTLGVLAGTWLKGGLLKGNGHSAGYKVLMLGCAAVLLVGARDLERPSISVPRIETFVQSVKVPASPAKAWQLIKSMNHLSGKKPFLLAIGLPVPQSCSLDADAVGAQRICYFDSGKIEQQVTEWIYPQKMRLKITDSTLPGRHWLTFVDAGYDFVPNGTNTLVIRETTISSKLYPRWYWRPFEAWGVQSEHEYVLNDLKRRAEEASK